jgi:hypothetical protein
MDENTKRTEVTAFAKSAEALRRRYGNVSLNASEFNRKLTRCSLSCKGMCCYGGVSVDNDTADVLQNLARERKSDFQEMGLDLPDPVVAPTEWHSIMGNITGLKPRDFRTRVKDYPAHFDETACVFLMEDARCGLQVLAQNEGKHPWYYKPFSCWLLPIKLWDGAIRLFDRMTDPFIYPDYPGFISRTFCGRTDEKGVPASELLTPELEYLGEILNRDLIGELAADGKSSTTSRPKA